MLPRDFCDEIYDQSFAKFVKYAHLEQMALVSMIDHRLPDDLWHYFISNFFMEIYGQTWVWD